MSNSENCRPVRIGSRLAGHLAPPLKRVLRSLLRAPVWLYRCRCGWLLGYRFLLLIHKGRRSGLQRHTVLEVMEFREADSEAVVMSAWGRNADWLRNIEKAPDRLQIVIGAQRFRATYRILGAEEAFAVIAGYERRHRLIAPVIRAGLSWLFGWRYDGSDRARRRAAEQVPYIAFRPLGQVQGPHGRD